MQKIKWAEDEIKQFCKNLNSRTYLQCNECGYLITAPEEKWVETERCGNCGKPYSETESEIRSIK